jgi:uncharacterized protein (DUF433 family)
MAKDLMAEVAKLRRVPGIIFADGPSGRRARVAGTGIDVFEIIDSYHQVGDDWKHLKQSFDWLSEEQLRAALAYYAAFPVEIDESVRSNQEPLENFWLEHPSSRPPWR